MGRLHKLTDRFIKTIKEPGRYSDGGNLYVAAKLAKSGKLSVTYSFKVKTGGRSREGGLGAIDKISLKDARCIAADWRALVLRGVDPIAARKGASEARKSAKTFQDAVDGLFASKGGCWSEIHKRQWLHSMKVHCEPLLKRDIASIDRQAVLSVLTPVWEIKPETGKRVRQRLEAVLGYAEAHGWRPGPNPAQWKGGLDAIFTTDRERTHFAALPYSEIPAFLADLRGKEGPGPAALEFLILTASRSAESIGARWDELDLDSKTWIIPAERMKAGREHRIPLSSRALEILGVMEAARQNEFVFPGRFAGKSISPDLLRANVPGFTVHGMRSAFRDWCGDQTSFPRDLAEACLAHATGNATEAAYRRSDALEKRRQVMESWSSYCTGTGGAKVLPIRQANK
jgi:integrase